MSRDRSTYIELQSSCEPNRLGQTSVESGTWMGTFSSRPGRIEKTAKVDINLHLVGLEDHRRGKLMIVLERPNAITTSFHYKNWQQSVGVSHLGSDRYKIYRYKMTDIIYPLEWSSFQRLLVYFYHYYMLKVLKILLNRSCSRRYHHWNPNYT